MSLAGLSLTIAVAVFCLLFTLVSVERQRGDRLLLRGVRTRIDRVCDTLLASVSRGLSFLIRHVIQWTWYLMVDVVLKSVLYVIVKVGDRLEASFYRNRQRTRALRAERAQRKHTGVLGAVAEHKETTALSEAEKQRLRKQSLEGSR